MGRRCPPGMICFEHFSIIILLILIFIFGYIFFLNNKFTNFIIPEQSLSSSSSSINPLPSFGYTNNNSILLNPYEPPLRNSNVFTEIITNRPPIPININTQGVDSSYRQVGILTRINGEENILPLMGRPLITNRDKWNFYTMTDKNNMIKLPVSHKGRSCTNEYGCDNIYNGDTVYVEGYKAAFRATIYDNDTMRYIPFL